MGTQKERIEQLETSLARLTERFDFLQTTLQLLAKGGTGALSWSQFCYSMQLLEAEVIVRGDKRPQEQCYIRTSQEAATGSTPIEHNELLVRLLIALEGVTDYAEEVTRRVRAGEMIAAYIQDKVGEIETARAAITSAAGVVTKNFCSQCGQKYTDSACGPTHAIMRQRLYVAPNDDTTLLDWCADYRVAYDKTKPEA